MGRDEFVTKTTVPKDEPELEILFRQSFNNPFSEKRFLDALLYRFGIRTISDEGIKRSVGFVNVEQMGKIVESRGPGLSNFTILDLNDQQTGNQISTYTWLTGSNWKIREQPVYSVIDAVSWGAIRHVIGQTTEVTAIKQGLFYGNATFITHRALNQMFAARQRNSGWQGH